MMNFYELDRMRHEIRERRAKEAEGVPVEELVRRANGSAEEYMAELGLRFVPEDEEAKK